MLPGMTAVVRVLLSRGVTVRALVRAASPRANLAVLAVTTVTGGIRDAAAMAQALSGCDLLFHVAADYRLWARDPGEIERTNIEGTRIVMQAAHAAGVARIVHTSGVATLEPSADGTPADETAALTTATAIGAYKRTKVGAERPVEAMAAEGLPVVIVNPSTPIGPRDIRPTPTGQIIVEGATGRIPAFVDTGLDLVHVDDVAAGQLLAAEHGVLGTRSILGGQDVMLERFLGDIAARTGRKAPTLRLPRAPLYPLAWAAEAAARVTGKEPMLTVDSLTMA
jgi:dihydroflavonol-4-reductase